MGTIVASAYLDTVLVSTLVRRDIDPVELKALDEILSRFRSKALALVCSDAVAEELARIPSAYRAEHLEQLKAFASIPRVGAGAVSRLTAAGVPGGNPRRLVWNRLRALLPDRPDAEHVFVAWTNRIECVLTWDKSTMLKHKREVQALCGVEVLLPTEFLCAASLGS